MGVQWVKDSKKDHNPLTSAPDLDIMMQILESMHQEPKLAKLGEV